jgi:hypothetical protein
MIFSKHRAVLREITRDMRESPYWWTATCLEIATSCVNGVADRLERASHDFRMTAEILQEAGDDAMKTHSSKPGAESHDR